MLLKVKEVYPWQTDTMEAEWNYHAMGIYTTGEINSKIVFHISVNE